MALDLPVLEGCQVLGGHNGLDRVIESVNVMETPDIGRFVAPAQLLLTTAYPLQRDPTAVRNLIPTLAEQHLAGLILKPRFMDEVPEEMIRQADALDFPLVSIPEDRPFAGILNAILTEVLEYKTAMLRHSDEVHRQLTDLVLQGKGLDAVAETLAALLRLPVLITDGQFRILADSGLVTAADGDFRAFIRTMQLEGLYPSGGEPVRRSILSEGRLSSVFIQPVRMGEEVIGHLCVWERDGELHERDALCVEQGALVTALELRRQQAVQETERRFYNEFLCDLLTGRLGSREEALARGSVYGWDLKRPRVLCLFRLQETGAQRTALDIHFRGQKKIERAIYYALEETRSAHLISHMGHGSILLLAPRHTGAEQAKEEALALAHRVVEELACDGESRGYTVHAGVSRLQHDVLAWSTAYHQAQEALSIGAQLAARVSVTHYDDLGSYRLLFRISDLDELERFCGERIGALIEYDAKNGTDLVTTLTAIIEADGNLHRAAARLSVHYNTLRYRVRRIEEIQGLKVDSWHQLSAADLALKAYRVLQARRSGGTL